MKNISFEEVLVEKREKVWPVIKNYLDDLVDFPDFCKVTPKYTPMAELHQKMVAEYPERKGKYLRPILVLLTASAMGFPEKKALQTAAAMQTSEDWILNHDDIEDGSLQRRGKPALHKIYGKELAINAGDTLHVMMWKILRDNLRVVGEKKGLAIVDEFFRMLDRTVLGQTVEIKWTQENKLNLTDEDIFFILESKTGYYTIAGPMRLGAILAGANKKQLADIYDFGKTLGRAFQIVDDLLDLTSDFKGQKKQIGNDIYEGKRTIMLMHLLREVKSDFAKASSDKIKVEEILKKNRDEKTEDEVLWMIEKMKEYGSLDYGRNLAGKFANEASEIFDKKLKFLNKQPARSQLKAGIDFIVRRNY